MQPWLLLLLFLSTVVVVGGNSNTLAIAWNCSSNLYHLFLLFYTFLNYIFYLFYWLLRLNSCGLSLSMHTHTHVVVAIIVGFLCVQLCSAVLTQYNENYKIKWNKTFVSLSLFAIVIICYKFIWYCCCCCRCTFTIVTNSYGKSLISPPYKTDETTNENRAHNFSCKFTLNSQINSKFYQWYCHV